MSVNGKFKDFSRQDFLDVADRFGIGEARSIIYNVEESIKAWPSFANKAEINQQVADEISQNHLKLK
ncbi:MAG TPA: hypothetical protein VNJ08_03050 [Bacteriovoracaceae bacterium]|nr:hypothetical protein [Bacteriovoracaceae bacterium]